MKAYKLSLLKGVPVLPEVFIGLDRVHSAPYGNLSALFWGVPVPCWKGHALGAIRSRNQLVNESAVFRFEPGAAGWEARALPLSTLLDEWVNHQFWESSDVQSFGVLNSPIYSELSDMLADLNVSNFLEHFGQDCKDECLLSWSTA